MICYEEGDFDDEFDNDSYLLDDPRIDDMQPILNALKFLREEAKRKNNEKIYNVIGSAYGICLTVYDILLEQGAISEELLRDCQ